MSLPCVCVCVCVCVHKGGGAASGRFPVNIDLCDSSVNDFIACDETRVEQEESPTPQDFYFFKSPKKKKQEAAHLLYSVI